MSVKNLLMVVVLSVLASVLVGCDGGDSKTCTPKPGEANCVSQGMSQDVPISAPVVKATVVPVKVQPTAAPVNVVKILATVVAVDVNGYVNCGTNAECIKDPAAFCKAHASASQCP